MIVTPGFRGDASTHSVKLLNLGCGCRPREGYLNVDQAETTRPDLVWDLNVYPYPLPKNHFEHIHVGDVVEHLENIPAFMEEFWDLLIPNGTVEITTPHFSCANSCTDPTHKYHLGYFSFDYFTETSELNFYSRARFTIDSRSIAFHHNLVNRVVRRLANRYPHPYEQRFAWIFPAWFLVFRLRAIK